MDVENLNLDTPSNSSKTINNPPVSKKKSRSSFWSAIKIDEEKDDKGKKSLGKVFPWSLKEPKLKKEDDENLEESFNSTLEKLDKEIIKQKESLIEFKRILEGIKNPDKYIQGVSHYENLQTNYKDSILEYKNIESLGLEYNFKINKIRNKDNDDIEGILNLLDKDKFKNEPPLLEIEIVKPITKSKLNQVENIVANHSTASENDSDEYRDVSPAIKNMEQPIVHPETDLEATLKNQFSNLDDKLPSFPNDWD